MPIPLNERRSLAELMDAPDVEPGAHREALAGLRRINRASGTVGRMAGPILAWARKGGKTSIRMLDVACGGGDVPVGVAGVLRRAGISVELTLMDMSATALEEAASLGRAAGVSVACTQGAAPQGLPAGAFDVVTNSLFLHHLTARATVETLAAMKDRVTPGPGGGLLVISDLRRSVMGYVIAWAGCRVLSRSYLVHHDGPVSVKAAWTLAELRGMAQEAGLEEGRRLRVERSWPWRMRLVWERGGGGA
jgi:2-polyprenyl-3-methyl-5-hydroxy-6-metoxy-1,4-benzoquinol methylase